MTVRERTGGCQCGDVRYRLAAEDFVVYACHCQECQKQSASAFALSIPVMRENIAIEGPLKSFDRSAESGAITHCWFCGSCGTRLYHQSFGSPDIVTLKGGTLDDTSRLEPVAHLWTKRKQPWLRLSGNVPLFETQPDDLRAWRERLLS